jgi:hypothetical protein
MSKKKSSGGKKGSLTKAFEDYCRLRQTRIDMQKEYKKIEKEYARFYK